MRAAFGKERALKRLVVPFNSEIAVGWYGVNELN